MIKHNLILIILFLFSINALSQNHILRQLTFSDSTHDGYPDWSPDGQEIFYSSGTRQTCYTMKIPIQGGGPVKITEYFAQHTKCSPDGKYFVFDGEFGTRIYLMSTKGGIPVRIIPESIPVVQSGLPCWSPDGQKIVFRSQDDLWIFELYSGNFKNIFHLDNTTVVPHQWSPDGKYVVVDVHDRLKRGQVDIWSVPVDEGEARQLTFYEGYQSKPSISPDGGMLLFSSNHGGNPDLWIMPSQGGEPVQITFFEGDENNRGFDVEGCWSPDGKQIAFSSTRSGYWAVWIMEPDLDYIKSKLSLLNK